MAGESLEKKSPLEDFMRSMVDRVRDMADANVVVGRPITTADGVTLIPISRLSFGFGSGGGTYGKPAKDGFSGAGAAHVKIDPVAFLTVRDGMTRVLPVAAPPLNTVDRIVDMAPDLLGRVENYFEQRKETPEKGNTTDH